MWRSKVIMMITFSLIFSLVQGCATLGDLSGIGTSSERVGQFPEGEQVNVLVGSMLSGLKDTNTETRVFAASYGQVWQAAIAAAERLDKIGKRPLTLADEKNGRISNGVISESAAIGAGSGAWMDEFLIEVTSIPGDKTKVDVTRKVVAKEIVAFGTRPGTYGMSATQWKTRYSNGNIEKWILTQIEDHLKK